MNPFPSKAVVFWSSGKDSSIALYLSQKDPHLEVVGLFSTVEESSKRIGFHGTPETLIQAQAESIGLPLWSVFLPPHCSNQDYESLVGTGLEKLRKLGVSHLVFGDLFLKDIREYRERFLHPLGFKTVFPLWERNTTHLSQEILALGFKATVCAVNPQLIPDSYLGRHFDTSFLSSLKPGIDPCGENGEFHTFVTDGPIFRRPVKIRLGQSHQDRFSHWVELLPEG
jgi:uncharacterized protein (TIGR00290 family)